jgi:hypothetical protein
MTKASENGKGEAVFAEKTTTKVESQPAGPLPKTAFQTGLSVEKHA